MPWCLIKEYADKFLEGLRSGEIDPQKMLNMTSAERRAFLSKYVGEWNAKMANREFESKLLLKNQQMGLITWAKKMSGLKKSAQNDIIAKIEKLGKAIDPATENQFLSDIVEQRLGTQIAASEGKIVVDFTNKLKSLYDPKLEKWEQSKEYWQTKQQLLKFLREKTLETEPITIGDKIRGGLTTGLSVLRAIKTGFDLSAPLRQGRALFGTKEWNGAFKRMFEYGKYPLAIDELEVKMLSNKYSEYALQNKNKLGLTLLGEKFTQREEQFGAKIIDKVPLLRGSERAFTGFLNDLRFNRFVKILEKFDKSGNGITDNPKAMEDLAKVIGASTGRGTLGSAEGAARSLATVLFSPRLIASRFQILLNPFTKGKAARTEAIKALARTVGTSVAILAMVKAAGGDVNTDPRSTDFAKVKIGNTRYDITGGLAPYITLLARTFTLQTVNAKGKMRKLNTGKFGQPTALDTLFSFFTSKTNPVASVIRDLLKGESFGEQKVEISLSDLKKNKDFAKYLADQLITPLLASDALSAYKDASGGIELGALTAAASLFGVGTNTYK